MVTIKNIIVSASILTIGILSINAVPKGDPKDALDKRIFKVIMTEVKEGAAPKKGLDDEIEFKGGKMFSQFLFDKLEYKWIKYEVKKDSVFTDEEYDIQGTIKITKKDKLKKKYEFTGKEKDKKKKK